MSSQELSVSAKIDAIRRCRALAGISAPAARLLAEIMETEIFDQNQPIISAGGIHDRLYLVTEGSVVLEHDENTEIQIPPGDLLGEECLLDNCISRSKITAADRSVLMSIDAKRFRAFLEEFPGVAIPLLKAELETR